MLYFIAGLAGLVAGVLLPVEYNAMIKNAVFAAINWIRTGPAETRNKGNDGIGE